MYYMFSIKKNKGPQDGERKPKKKRKMGKQYEHVHHTWIKGMALNLTAITTNPQCKDLRCIQQDQHRMPNKLYPIKSNFRILLKIS
jgi:hypothetical protein